MCHMEPSCVSMNFGPKVGGNFTCELNQDHSSEGDQSPPVPQSKNGHIYLAIEVRWAISAVSDSQLFPSFKVSKFLNKLWCCVGGGGGLVIQDKFPSRADGCSVSTS